MARATWFCVDIECAGPVPGLYDMVSLGAIVVGGGDGQPFTIGDRFYAEIRPTAPHMDPRAMAVNGLDFDRLLIEGKPLEDVLRSLTSWVEENTVTGSSPVFVGHNAPFDWSFVNHGYHAHGLPNPFGYKALDTKALASGVLDLHWFDSHKEALAERLVLPPVEADKVHRADYDAWYQAHILIGLLTLQAASPRPIPPAARERS
ncbi:MAG: ribonuclease T [Myxococcota bacterium]|jgi:ribonuclease T